MPFPNPGWNQPFFTQNQWGNGWNNFPNSFNMNGFNPLMNLPNNMGLANFGGFMGNNGLNFNNLLAKYMGPFPNNMMNPFGGNLLGSGLGGNLLGPSLGGNLFGPGLGGNLFGLGGAFNMLSLFNGGFGGSTFGGLLNIGKFLF